MYLRIELLSDTAFGRGDGVASLVNSEVEHDKITGLPIIKGRTLKGLFVEACADILYGLQTCHSPAYKKFEKIALVLFGVPGSNLESTGSLYFGTATLPDGIEESVKASGYAPTDVLEAFTTIRHQTAVDEETNTPKNTSLRATRAVLGGTIFHAHIAHPNLSDDEIALLWACANTIRNAGQNRARGLGYLLITLYGEDLEQINGDSFNKLVKGEAS